MKRARGDVGVMTREREQVDLQAEVDFDLRDEALRKEADAWLSPSEAARVLHVSPHWIGQLIRAGRVNYRWTRGGREVAAADVRRLARERGTTGLMS
jgi:hypothetical protein